MVSNGFFPNTYRDPFPIHWCSEGVGEGERERRPSYHTKRPPTSVCMINIQLFNFFYKEYYILLNSFHSVW